MSSPASNPESTGMNKFCGSTGISGITVVCGVALVERGAQVICGSTGTVSYTHLTLPTNREV